jgi:hypothetical protein
MYSFIYLEMQKMKANLHDKMQYQFPTSTIESFSGLHGCIKTIVPSLPCCDHITFLVYAQKRKIQVPP